MGCGASSPIEVFEMADKCPAEHLRFYERFDTIQGRKRNIAHWLPLSDRDIKGVVFISHGLGEHALCYYHVAQSFVSKGYAVFAIDHVSHGKSDGKRGIIPSHKIIVDDFVEFVNERRKGYVTLPAFVVAHSMGTLVALAGLSRLQDITAIVLSGPALFAGPAAASPFGISCLYPLTKTPVAVCLTNVTSVMDPGGPAAPLVMEEITNNEEVLALMHRDYRRNKPFVANQTAKVAITLIANVKKEVPKMKMPFLCIHGEQDHIALKSGSEFIFKNAGTDIPDRKLHIVLNLKHEVFNEPAPKGQECIDYVVDYIEGHFQRVQSSSTSTSTATAAPADAAVVEKAVDVEAIEIGM